MIIHQFPLYWFSVPAIHKAWEDKVLSYYYAYGGPIDGLKGKKWLTSVTTGGPLMMYTKEGYAGETIENLLKHFNVNTPAYLKMEVIAISLECLCAHI